MNATFVLLKKEIQLFLRDKAALLLTFLVPFFIIYIVGNIFSGQDEGGGIGAEIKLAVLDEAGTPLSAKLVEALQDEDGLDALISRTEPDGSDVPFSSDSIRQGIVDHEYNFALMIPPDFVKQEGIGLRLRFLSNPKNQIEAQIVNGLIQKTVFTQLPDLLSGRMDELQRERLGDGYDAFREGLVSLIALTYEDVEYEQIRDSMSFSGLVENLDSMLGSTGEGDAEETEEGTALQGLVEIDEDQVFGAEVSNPYLTRMIGGYAIMFLLFATTGSAASLFEERNEGLFLRLLSMPVKRTHILWSKYLFNTLLGIVQTMTLFIASSFLFDVDVFENFASLLIVSIFAASACTAFGMLLAAVSRTPQQAQGFGTLIIISMSALGGAWFPLAWMPEAMQIVGKLTIVYWGVEAYLAALWEGASVTTLLPYLGVMLAISVVLNLICAWRFRAGELFR